MDYVFACSPKVKKTQKKNLLDKSTLLFAISRAKIAKTFVGETVKILFLLHLDQTNSFVRAKSELEFAQYMLKSDGLMLHPEFLQRLRALPQAYVYGEYRQIYRDYGTHYITEAALGGQYDYTIILNKEHLENSGTRTDSPVDLFTTS